MPRVVVAEMIAEAGLALLRAHADVDVAAGADRSVLLQRLPGADALIVRSATQVDAEMIEAAPNLRVIGRAGIGVDNIDLGAATRAGVLVVNAPAANVVSAAEHTMALLLSQARRIPEADRTLRGGTWDRSRFSGVELYGKTLGLIGLGRVGTLVARRASAFGMRLLVYDPYVGPDAVRRLGAESVAELRELLSEADFVTVHVPRTRQTEALLDAETLKWVKPGMRLVNTSRGGIVDEQALAEGIRSGRIAGAALDVFAEEPLTESPLFALPEVVITPHLGATTVEAQDKAGIDVAAAVVSALAGDLVTGAVNVDIGAGVSDEVRSFLPVAERLGAIFVALTRALPNELLVRVEGRLAAEPIRPLALAALKGALSRIVDGPVSFVNAPSLADERGIRLLEESTSETADFQSVIRVTGQSGGRPFTVAGTLMGSKGPVLTEVFDHEIELPFSPFMLVLLNDDVPGVIGGVGTYLGDLGVNIANMVVGRSHTTGESAVMGLNLDRALDDEEVAGLRELRGVTLAIFTEWS